MERCKEHDTVYRVAFTIAHVNMECTHDTCNVRKYRHSSNAAKMCETKDYKMLS